MSVWQADSSLTPAWILTDTSAYPGRKRDRTTGSSPMQYLLCTYSIVSHFFFPFPLAGTPLPEVLPFKAARTPGLRLFGFPPSARIRSSATQAGTLFSISPSLSLFLPRARIGLFHHGDWTSQDQWGTSPAGRPPTVEFVDVGIVSKVLYCVFQYNPLHAPAYPWHNPRPSRATGCNYHCSTCRPHLHSGGSDWESRLPLSIRIHPSTRSSVPPARTITIRLSITC